MKTTGQGTCSPWNEQLKNTVKEKVEKQTIQPSKKQAFSKSKWCIKNGTKLTYTERKKRAF